MAFAFSDEHYPDEVTYLRRNINYSTEQVAFGLDTDPLTSGIIAGFEGVYIAGQLVPSAGIMIYPTKSFQLADEKYPVKDFILNNIFEKIAGRKVKRIRLLTPRQVIPDEIVTKLEEIAGKDNVTDIQSPLQKIKNLRNENETRLSEDAVLCHLSCIARHAGP